jgi:hypothetical protein
VATHDPRAVQEALFVWAGLQHIDRHTKRLDARWTRLTAAHEASGAEPLAGPLPASTLSEAQAIHRDLRRLRASLALIETYLHERSRELRVPPTTGT